MSRTNHPDHAAIQTRLRGASIFALNQEGVASPASRYIVTVSSPLQLRNAAAFLRSRSVVVQEVPFIVCMSGQFEWDQQTLNTAKKLGVEKIVLVPGSRSKAHRTHLSQSTTGFSKRVKISAMFGSVTFGKFVALLVAKSIVSVRRKAKSCRSILVTGMPLNLLPFYPLVLGTKRRVVIVDDGLSTLEFFRRRTQEAQIRWAARPWRLFVCRPGLCEKKLLCFTLFADVFPPPGVAILPNRAFSLVPSDIRIKTNESWILGNPFVEEGGLDSLIYRELIQSVYQALSRHTPTIRYLPHRRENPAATRKLLQGTSVTLADWQDPVEERVLEIMMVAQTVVGFSSTALEILEAMTPPGCNLWNVLFVPPRAKTGRDSPEAIFERHSRRKRIKTVTAEELQSSQFPGLEAAGKTQFEHHSDCFDNGLKPS